MKISPELILLKPENDKPNENFFLISGNEETLIRSVENKIINLFKATEYDEVIRTEGLKLNKNNAEGVEGSFFSETNIIVHKNPKDVDFSYFDSKKNDGSVVIITHYNLKSSSKLKREFDKLKGFSSISCYEMSKVFKKKIAETIFNKNSIKFEKDAFWYFIEMAPNAYGLFINEVKKIVNYNKKNLTMKDLTLLLSGDLKNDNFDLLFFLILTNKSEIITKMKNIIQGPSDAYILIQRAKFYIEMVMTSKKLSDIDIFFPKYLFMHRNSFRNFFEKTNEKKIIQLLKFLKKTEILLRKNSDLYFLICQRFLLNLNNIIK